MGSTRVGIDIGGTFTDLVLIRDDSGEIMLGKTLTTPADPSLAVRQGLVALLAEANVAAGELDALVHGTTLAVNAIIERKGATTGLVTTRGFRDLLQIGREKRYDMFDLNIAFPTPLVPRRRRHEVTERVAADGTVVIPLDEAEVASVVAQLAGTDTAAVAVCFLHAYGNPSHERRTGAIISERAPDLAVSLSSDVLPQIREYERLSATVMNAYIAPIIRPYLEALGARLTDLGYRRGWYVMASNGGVLAPETAASYPIRLLESGPVGGALAAAYIGAQLGLPNLIAFDMGGTSAKACIIEGSTPGITFDFEVARVKRFARGSGLPLKLPVIDMLEIGAGGGSIAWADDLGLINVGPESAGAMPGPACYGQGGTAPTVTDANVVLGYLNPRFFLGGAMLLDVPAAERSLAALADRVGLSTTATAWGIHDIVTTNMAEAVRVHAAERGIDYSRLSLFAFGGAGPLHAYGIARLLGVRTVVFPRAAGVFSALGFLTAPLSFDYVVSDPARLGEVNPADVRRLYSAMEASARATFAEAGLPEPDIVFDRSADIRYVGQGFEVTVPLPPGYLDDGGPESLALAFRSAYQARYGRTIDDVPPEVVSWRLLARGPVPRLRLASTTGSSALDPVKARRPIFLPDARRFVECPVYDRLVLAPGVVMRGPALVEERECTILIGPSATAWTDQFGNVVMDLERPVP